MKQNDQITFAEPILDIKVYAYTIPTDFPESDGTLKWDATTIIIVEIFAGGKVGIGYTYSDKSAAVLIKEKLAGLLKSQNALAINSLWQDMLISVRNLGSRGITANAISAIDCALWDLKAKLLNVPLITLLGQARNCVNIYGSGGFTSYSDKQLQEQLKGWVKEGISMVKMKIGREPDKDIKRVRLARKSIGEEIGLFVDANGAYTAKQAINQAEKFSEFNIKWFEEPVSSDNLKGLRFIKDKVTSQIEIAAGEYGYDIYYFKNMLKSGAVDVLQADATRCLGITGFIKTSDLCEAYNIPLSAHTAPVIHLHPCCALYPVRHIEYFHDHARIEKIFFEGFPENKDGKLYPCLSEPGLGIKIKRKDIEKYLVYK